MDDIQVEAIRKEFPALNQRRNGLPPIYFDNACTTLVPAQVIQTIRDYYEIFPACGGERSRHWFSSQVQERLSGSEDTSVKGSREIIQTAINARYRSEIIFTQNTSQAINLVALGLQFSRGDRVLVSDQEHNSNLLPWLRLKKQGIIELEIKKFNTETEFNLNLLEESLSKYRTQLVSLAYTSNVTGSSIPAPEIIRLAHQYGARVLLDAAQTIPHSPIDVQALDVDFLAFSLHKMCGPRGVGILYGKKEYLGSQVHEELETSQAILPSILGGSTVGDIENNKYYLLDPPERFEPGIQNYPGQIAAGTAFQYLSSVGYKCIREHLTQLNNKLTTGLLNDYGDSGWFRILGPKDPSMRAGILTFQIERPNVYGITEELSDTTNIMIRDGAFCAHTYFNQLYGFGWTRPRLPSEHILTFRVSLYFYNTTQECDQFLASLRTILTDRCYI